MIGIIGSLLIVVCSVDSSNMAELFLPRCLSFPTSYPSLYTSFKLATELRSEQQVLSAW